MPKIVIEETFFEKQWEWFECWHIEQCKGIGCDGILI